MIGGHLTSSIRPERSVDNGSLEEFEALYQRYFRRLVHDLRSSVLNRATAEDLAQETLVRAFVKLDRFDSGRPLWPWIRGISRRILADQGPGLSREILADPPDAAGVSPELAGIEDRAVLSAALARLHPRHRAAMGLRYVQDWEPEHAAAFLGVSLAGFHQLLFRARERLRLEYRRLTDGVPILVALRWYRARMRGLVRRVGRGAGELTTFQSAEPLSRLAASAGILLLLALVQPLGVGAPPAQADAGPGLIPRPAPMPSEGTVAGPRLLPKGSPVRAVSAQRAGQAGVLGPDGGAQSGPVTPEGTPPADGAEQPPSGGGTPEPPGGGPTRAPTAGLSPEDSVRAKAPVASDSVKVTSPAGSNVVSIYTGDPIPIPVPVPEPLPDLDPGPLPTEPLEELADDPPPLEGPG